MAKGIYITMKDNSVWRVPAHVVASDRARYYAEREGADEFSGEYDFAMGADGEYELECWARGQMNWEDVVSHAVLVQDAPPLTDSDFQEGWVNGKKEIINDDLE